MVVAASRVVDLAAVVGERFRGAFSNLAREVFFNTKPAMVRARRTITATGAKDAKEFIS